MKNCSPSTVCDENAGEAGNTVVSAEIVDEKEGKKEAGEGTIEKSWEEHSDNRDTNVKTAVNAISSDSPDYSVDADINKCAAKTDEVRKCATWMSKTVPRSNLIGRKMMHVDFLFSTSTFSLSLWVLNSACGKLAKARIHSSAC